MWRAQGRSRIPRIVTGVVAGTVFVAVGVVEPAAVAAPAGTVVLASGLSGVAQPLRVTGASSAGAMYLAGPYYNSSLDTVPTGSSNAVTLPAVFATAFPLNLVGSLVTGVTYDNTGAPTLQFVNIDGSGAGSVSVPSGYTVLTGSADGEYLVGVNSTSTGSDVFDLKTTGGAPVDLGALPSDFLYSAASAADSDGLALAYQASSPTCSSPSSAWGVLFLATGSATSRMLQASACAPYPPQSLAIGGGFVAWGSSSSDTAGSFTVSSVPETGGTVRSVAAGAGFLGQVSATSSDIGWQTQAGSAWTFSSIPAGGGSVSTAGFASTYGLASTGSQFVLAEDDTVSDDGVYTVPDASGTPTGIFTGGPAALAATSIALGPGAVAYSDNSSASLPVWSRTLTSAGGTLTAGSPSMLAGSSTGYGLSVSGLRSTYLSTTTSGTTVTNTLDLSQPGGSPRTIAADASGAPLSTDLFNGAEPTLSGMRVLYSVINVGSTTTPTLWRLYDVGSATTADLPSTGVVSYALWGDYLVWFTTSGAVERRDLATGVTTRIATISVPSGDTLSGRIAVWGDATVWGVGLFPTGGGGQISSSIGYLEVPAGATPGTPTTFAAPLGDLVLSNGYLAYAAQIGSSPRPLTVVPLSGGSPVTVTSQLFNGVNQSGQFSLDNSTVGWVDGSGATLGEPEAAPLAHVANPPYYLGDGVAPASYLLGGANWNAELVTSAPLTSCAVTISQGSTTVRTLACNATDLGVGDAQVSWDGTDTAGSVVAPGSYTWTLTGANGDGSLLNSDGSTRAVSGTITVSHPGSFHPSAPVRLLDTRVGTGAPKAAVPAYGVLTLTLPTSRVPAGASAVVLNVTVTQPSALSGHITVFPGGSGVPNASNLNFVRGETIPNLVVVAVGSGGRVSFFNGSGGTVQLVADLAGYYTAP